MSKYLPLQLHLEGLKAGTWKASFSEIEKILGAPLPRSARVHREWWANDRSAHVQSHYWMKAGWRTEVVDVASERVTFERVSQ